MVQGITYRPLKGDFAVLRLRLDDGTSLTAVGDLGHLTGGERIRLFGHWVDHPTYGRQFRAERAERRRPTTREGLEAFLQGPRFKGIGPVLARRIVQTLGTAVLEVGKDPQALAAVPGLGMRKARELARQFRDVDEEARGELLLFSAGIRGAMVSRVRRALGEGAVEKIQRNPYLLAEVVEGVGFKRADAVAARLGVSPEAKERVQAALLHALREAEGEGHTFQTREDLAGRIEALGVGRATEADLRDLAGRGALALEGERVYPVHLLGAESRAARLLARRLSLTDHRRPAPHRLGDLSPVQAEAVALALRAPVAVLTGGPGTGKTTTIRGIVAAAAEQGLRLALAAPSGRAARRLMEATGHPAQTLHRLLKLRPGGGFVATPVEADLIVVDEASMLDILLVEALLSAVPRQAGLLLVGDADQLPPVGPGNPFVDLVASGRVPTVRLEKIYRQDEGGRLYENAHRIREGRFPLTGGRDFVWHRVGEPEEAAALVVKLAQDEVRAFGVDDVVVLSAGNRFAVGTESLNQRLQTALNAGGAAGRLGRLTLRVGDKVLQRKNDYRKGVFNGEIGRVKTLRPEEAEVRFPSPEGEILVAYTEEDAPAISLGYALTVHKAQGSEFPVAVVVLSTQHYPLLRRNLFYTAVTRAKARLHLVASPRAVALALKNDSDGGRRSAFGERIRDLREQGG